jgi:zinc transport system ATP-binding protein
MPDILSISSLDFAYNESLVLKNVSLHVQAGTTLGLIGPNGGGKTTLIRLLLGLLQPTRGDIAVDGLPPRNAVRRGNVIGYLPQNPPRPDNLPLSVLQAARLGLVGKTGLLKSYPRDDLQFVDDLLNRLGIADLAQSPIASLSGGQLQRVLIARALAARPKILLLDEPTTGLDRLGHQHFLESISTLKQQLGLTIVFVSHDLRAVSAIADRIACLNLTLHYHAVPEHIPADRVYHQFGCDLEALGLGACGTPTCNDPQHHHVHINPAVNPDPATIASQRN